MCTYMLYLCTLSSSLRAVLHVCVQPLPRPPALQKVYPLFCCAVMPALLACKTATTTRYFRRSIFYPLLVLAVSKHRLCTGRVYVVPLARVCSWHIREVQESESDLFLLNIYAGEDK